MLIPIKLAPLPTYSSPGVSSLARAALGHSQKIIQETQLHHLGTSNGFRHLSLDS